MDCSTTSILEASWTVIGEVCVLKRCEAPPRHPRDFCSSVMSVPDRARVVGDAADVPVELDEVRAEPTAKSPGVAQPHQQLSGLNVVRIVRTDEFSPGDTAASLLVGHAHKEILIRHHGFFPIGKSSRRGLDGQIGRDFLRRLTIFKRLVAREALPLRGRFAFRGGTLLETYRLAQVSGGWVSSVACYTPYILFASLLNFFAAWPTLSDLEASIEQGTPGRDRS